MYICKCIYAYIIYIYINTPFYISYLFFFYFEKNK